MRGGRVTIAGLMAVIAASGFAALGVRHFRAAYIEGLPESYAGDGNVQDFCVLAEAIPALAYMALAGAICGMAARRSRASRIAAWAGRARRLVLFTSVPILLGAALMPLPTVAQQVVWGSAFFATALLRVADRERPLDITRAVIEFDRRRTSLVGRTEAKP